MNRLESQINDLEPGKRDEALEKKRLAPESHKNNRILIRHELVRFYLEVSPTSLLFFLGVFFHLLDLRVFKIFVATPVGLPRVSGFPVIIIGDPVFFDVMAGPALFGPSEKGSFIIGSNRSHMIGRIKIFMNVTAFAIFINNIIVL